MFMSVLDTSIVNVAIPTMQKEFGVTTDDIEWVTTAYTLCLGVIVPTSAWLGDRLGLRRLYVICLLGFSLFSALCGMAGGLGAEIAFRVLQAVPGGVIPVTCLTLLYRIVPQDKRGLAMGMYGFGIVFAPGAGPTLGGYLVDNFSWRLIFYINVPIGVLGALAALTVLPRAAGTRTARFDVPGFACVAAGLFALLLAVSEGQTWGWTSYPILILAAAGVNLLALFVVIELQVAKPLLDVRVFSSWAFVNSVALISILFIGMFAVLFYVPLFLQQGQRITALNTGLVLLPQALVMLVITPFAGRLYDRIGARWPAAVGLALDAVGTLLMIQINADMTRPELIWWLMVRSAGIGLAMMPIMTSGISALPPVMVGSGSAFNTLFQRVSSALGLAALTALATTQQAQYMADRSAMYPLGAQADPQIVAMAHPGPGGLIGLWEQLRLHVQAQAYANVLLIAGASAAVAAMMALFLPNGRPSGGQDAAPVEA
jgi:EmrB/QacA subfamily drug resistance transporter